MPSSPSEMLSSRFASHLMIKFGLMLAGHPVHGKASNFVGALETRKER